MDGTPLDYPNSTIQVLLESIESRHDCSQPARMAVQGTCSSSPMTTCCLGLCAYDKPQLEGYGKLIQHSQSNFGI